MALEAAHSRHVAVAIPEVLVHEVFSARPRKQRPKAQ
jgi:hypothetical protein